MLLRNGKRKLNRDETLPRKKSKIVTQQDILYVNDANTKFTALTSLWNVGPKKAFRIFVSKLSYGRFASANSFVDRINGITERTLLESDVEFAFNTRYEKKQQEIYNLLLQLEIINELFANNEKQILKIITSYSVGNIVKCDNEDCDEVVVMIDEPDLYGKMIEQQYHNVVLAPVHDYMYYEYDTNYQYYFRLNETLGDVIYCDECSRFIRNCLNCQAQNYFHNDPETYCVCPGVHEFQRINANNDVDVIPFGYKMCESCSCCCEHEAVGNVHMVMTHAGCHQDCFLSGRNNVCNALIGASAFLREFYRRYNVLLEAT